MDSCLPPVSKAYELRNTRLQTLSTTHATMSFFWDFDPFHEMDVLQRRLDRLYNAAPALDDKTSGQLSRCTSERGAPLTNWRPHIDVKETDKEIVLHADVPGVSENDVNVSIEDGVLTVSGKRECTKKDKNERYHRVERSYGSFSRSVALPDNVDPAQVKANFENGVLEVRVPKPELLPPKKVTVSITNKVSPNNTAPKLPEQQQQQQQQAAPAESEKMSTN